MEIIDTGPYQAWVQAFDRYERAERRYNAAANLNHAGLMQHLAAERESARMSLNAAISNLG